MFSDEKRASIIRRIDAAVQRAGSEKSNDFALGLVCAYHDCGAITFNEYESYCAKLVAIFNLLTEQKIVNGVKFAKNLDARNEEN